jgi:hypothetical protein
MIFSICISFLPSQDPMRIPTKQPIAAALKPLSPSATGSELAEAVSQSIVDLKKENPGYGARRIGDILNLLQHEVYFQAISKKPFGPISLLESKFKSSEYLSIPPV